METKTDIATFVLVVLGAYFIGKYKGAHDEKVRKQEERLNNLEHLLNNF